MQLKSDIIVRPKQTQAIKKRKKKEKKKKGDNNLTRKSENKNE